jgi:hypothetical protein
MNENWKVEHVRRLEALLTPGRPIASEHKALARELKAMNKLSNLGQLAVNQLARIEAQGAIDAEDVAFVEGSLNDAINRALEARIARHWPKPGGV